jgi:hypothetical protein
MTGHLKQFGWPDVSEPGALVLQEVPTMHLKLLENGLIPGSFTLQTMTNIALHEKRSHDLFERMQADAVLR